MSPHTLEEQLIAYLTDAHALERQALAQLRRAPKLAGDEALAAVLRVHESETERHEQLVRTRLEAHGASPSRVKDAVMEAGGLGFVLFAGSQPDTPGKLAAHAYSYEHLELAAYELLARVAELAGDADTVAVAREIRDEEAAMACRIEATFDGTVAASLQAGREHDPAKLLDTYLADAHALEEQALGLLDKAIEIGGPPELTRAYADHLEETRAHGDALERRLAQRGARPSKLKDAALRVGAVNWAMFFAAQPDTPGKLAAFAFAFEHLEIAGYEQLARVARAAGDPETVALAERILREERAAAGHVADGFDVAVQGSLQALGVATA
jgi:ferritin-like metal-binding protein YciE